MSDSDEMLGRVLGKLGDIETGIAEDREERRALSRRVGALEKWREGAGVNLSAIREEVKNHGTRLTSIDGKLDRLTDRLFRQADADSTQNRAIAKLDKSVTVLSLKQKIAIAASGLGLGNVDRVYDWVRSTLQATGK